MKERRTTISKEHSRRVTGKGVGGVGGEGGREGGRGFEC
jgi:hypothetical protein